MKSKKPPPSRVQTGVSSPASGSERGEGDKAIILDFVQSRIETFNQEQGGGISVRKDGKGYTLIRDDNGQPVARLRIKDRQGHFEVLYWNPDSERWRKVGAFGGTILPLEDALDFIADDPMDCFWL